MIIKLELTGLFRGSDTHSNFVADIRKAFGDGSLIILNGLDFAVIEYSETDYPYHNGGTAEKSRRYHVNAVIELDGKND